MERQTPCWGNACVLEGRFGSTQTCLDRSGCRPPETGKIVGNRWGADWVDVTGASEDEYRPDMAIGAASVDRTARQGSPVRRPLVRVRPGGRSMQIDDEPFSFDARDEAWLIDRACRGDHPAYGELVRRYAALAHWTAASIVGPADAEDAVQDALVRAFYALGRFRQGSPFKPWLLAIVANCARNKARPHTQQARLRSRLLGAAGAPATTSLHVVESAESSALGAQDRRDLARAVDALPENARLVVTCRYLLELSEAETAQVLGWPVGTVKSRLSRALTRLRQTIAETAPENRMRP